MAPGQKFSNLDQPYLCEHSGLNLKLGEQSELYFFSVGVFPDEEAGKAFIPKLWAGLMWALPHQGLSPEAKLSPQVITYTEDPWEAARNVSKSWGLKGEKLDGILDGFLPAVYGSAHEFHVNGASRAVVDAPQAGDAHVCIYMIFFKINGAHFA